jgi:hypothetical protein
MQRTLTTHNLLHGRAPYGYRIAQAESTDHKTLVIEPTEATIIRDAVHRYLSAGESIAKICDDLNARGIPSPTWKGEPGKHWHVKTLAELLRSPSIAGHRIDAHGKTILRYEGIISWQDHERIIKRMDSRANRKGISPANAFMLTGVIHDVSGHPMYGVVHRNRWRYYYCKSCGFTVHIDEAERRVSEAVLQDHGHLPHMVPRLIPGKNYFEEIARLRQDRNELNEDELGAEVYDQRHAEITAEIRRLSNLPAEPDEVKRVKSGKTIVQHWKTLNPAGRRDWLKENGWKITVIKDDESPDGWRMFIDAGWTAQIGAEQQLESLGYPVSDELQWYADLPKTLGIPPADPNSDATA